MLIDFNGIFTRNADKSAHKILVTIADDDDDDCHRRFTSLFQIFDFFSFSNSSQNFMGSLMIRQTNFY